MNFFHQINSQPQIIHNNKIVFQPHLHKEVEIIVLFNGSAVLIADGNEHTLSSGDFAVIFPNVIHGYTSENQVDVGKFIFNLEIIPELKVFFENNCLKTPILDREKVKQAGLDRLVCNLLREYETSSAAVRRAYLLMLAGKTAEICTPDNASGAANDTLSLILDYCTKNFHRRITQSEVAKALHISESYLSHIFCSKIKINFRTYLNNLRVNEACELLSKTNRSITEVAELSGFSDLRTFNRAFLRMTGMPPRDYRKGS